MLINYTEEQTFKKVDFTQNPLSKGEYECCTFLNCDFSNTDLSGCRFLECEFSACNLSLAKLTKTSFQNVAFRNCKMLGLHFEECNSFGLAIGFDNCLLSHSSFFRKNLKKRVFKDSKLDEVDFAECDLRNAVFDNCDLANATFDNTNLEKTNFQTAYNYTINPVLNRIKKARFSLPGLPGLLANYDIEID